MTDKKKNSDRFTWSKDIGTPQAFASVVEAQEAKKKSSTEKSISRLLEKAKDL